MKKILCGGLIAALLSFSIPTMVYAENVETENLVSITESVDEIIDENNSAIEEEGTEEVIPENSAETESPENAEQEGSALQVWFETNIMPYLGTIAASAGGAGAVMAILSLLIKWLLGKIESKLKEAYEKKAQTDADKADFNALMLKLTNSLDNTIEDLKEVYNQKGETLQEAAEAFAQKYAELHTEMIEIYKIVEQMTAETKELENTVASENKNLHELMKTEQKEMLTIAEEDMKLITDILTIAFTNMPNLVSNGYATSIKKAVQNYEEKKRSKNP